MRKIYLALFIILLFGCTELFKKTQFDFGDLSNGIYSNEFLRLKSANHFRIKPTQVFKKWDDANIVQEYTHAFFDNISSSKKSIPPQKKDFHYNDSMQRYIPMNKIERASFLFVKPVGTNFHINFEIINLEKFDEVNNVDEAIMKCKNLRLLQSQVKKTKTPVLSANNIFKKQTTELSSNTIFIDNRLFKTVSFSMKFKKKMILFSEYKECILKIDFNYKEESEKKLMMNILHEIEFY